jgi:hypothetical protein
VGCATARAGDDPHSNSRRVKPYFLSIKKTYDVPQRHEVHFVHQNRSFILLLSFVVMDCYSESKRDSPHPF